MRTPSLTNCLTCIKKAPNGDRIVTYVPLNNRSVLIRDSFVQLFNVWVIKWCSGLLGSAFSRVVLLCVRLFCHRVASYAVQSKYAAQKYYSSHDDGSVHLPSADYNQNELFTNQHTSSYKYI